MARTSRGLLFLPVALLAALLIRGLTETAALFSARQRIAPRD